MAEVALEVGGRRYEISCRDGEEAHLRTLAQMVDEKAHRARAAVPGVNEARQLLLAALLLADELSDLRQAQAPTLPTGTGEALAEAVEQIAARVERLAEHLEGRAGNT